MIRSALLVLIVFGLAILAASQTTPNSQPTGPALNVPGDTVVLAKLTTILDLQQCTPGEPVEAQTTHDVKAGKEVLLKKGSTLLGHVTSVELASPKQPDNMVGVIFDGVRSKKGSPQTIHLLIRALAPQSERPENSTVAGGRGIPGEFDHVIASGHDETEHGGIEPLTTSSIGVSGLPGLQLRILKTSGGKRVSILAWSKGEIRLKKETQLVVGE